jgi:hypothetical protein
MVRGPLRGPKQGGGVGGTDGNVYVPRVVMDTFLDTHFLGSVANISYTGRTKHPLSYVAFGAKDLSLPMHLLFEPRFSLGPFENGRFPYEIAAEREGGKASTSSYMLSVGLDKLSRAIATWMGTSKAIPFR